MQASRLTLLLLAGVLIAGCGGDKTAQGGNTAAGVAGDQLPTPAGARGSAVTGMPDAPGPGQVGPPLAGDGGAFALDEDGNPLLPPESIGSDPSGGPVPVMPPLATTHAIADGEPAAQEAIGVVRDYYTAINARNYAQAYRLWSDGGRATNQSAEQFAQGFARTNGVSVELMAPGRIDAAAGSRYIEVPVALTATLDDGSQQKYVGMYTLRRSVLDGASPNQRAWRIASADLRAVQP